ncbi:transcription termination factor Rho [Pseudonocardia sp. ICBG162]|uniref:transcription termination factor Rho n=1 Tax=Pseudonocardia sp. ICBG162 TaxID=2846761 RepID=UPI001CF6B263|nr:transcription termination factor Rho [Pseudonocardia sp. ICBG162]
MSETDLAGTGTASAEAAPRRRGGLSGMVLAELRQLATELNVPDISGMRKGDLIAAIKERQGGAAAAPAKKPKAKADPAATTGSDGADAPQLALGDTAAAPAGNGSAAPAAPQAPAEQAGDQGGQAAEQAEAPAPRTRRRRAATRPAGAPDATVTDAATGDTGTSAGNGAAPAAAESAPAAAPEQAAPAASAPEQADSTPAPAEERREDADGAGRRGRTRRRGQGDDNGQKDTAPQGAPKDTATDAGQRDAGQKDARRDADGDDPATDGDRRRGRGADRNAERGADRNGGDRTGEGRDDNGRGNGDNGRGGRNRDGDDSGRGNRGNRNNDRTGDRGDNRGERNGDRNNDRNADRVNDRNNDRNNDRGADRNDFRDDDGDDGDGRGRRGRRFRDRRRGRDRERTGGGAAGGGVDTEIRDDDVLLPVAGIVDILDNYAFVRTTGYLSGPTDVYVSMSMVRKNGLRRGDAITGAVRQPREGEQQRQKFNPLVRVDSINGRDPEAARNRPEFTKLTPLYPNERLRLETDPSQLTTRVIDLIMPVGKGQRALIVSPPKAGKTTIMQNIANAITTNNPECHLMVVLVDERPEEVTDMQRSVKGEVIASTFDRPPADHTAVAELSIERAKRLVEMGHDVVVLLDNITRLGRAYNLAAPASGRILSGGVDSTALYPPKRFLGAARNIEDGGSLTIFATALVETGSTMDTVIFEEFKGTGNAELKLDRKIADKRIFPAIDVGDSSTRKEELLMSPDEHAVMVKLRRVLAALDDQQALDLVLSRLKKTKTNIEFLMQVAKNTPGKDED